MKKVKKKSNGVVYNRGAFKKARKRGNKFALQLIRNKTPAEEHLIELLMKAKVTDWEFQKIFLFPKWPRIVDFYFNSVDTAVELDGSHHYHYKGRKNDARRRDQFKIHYPHVRFLRYSNDEVFKPGFIDELLRDLKFDAALQEFK